MVVRKMRCVEKQDFAGLMKIKNPLIERAFFMCSCFLD